MKHASRGFGYDSTMLAAKMLEILVHVQTGLVFLRSHFSKLFNEFVIMSARLTEILCAARNATAAQI